MVCQEKSSKSDSEGTEIQIKAREAYYVSTIGGEDEDWGSGYM